MNFKNDLAATESETETETETTEGDRGKEKLNIKEWGCLLLVAFLFLIFMAVGDTLFTYWKVNLANNFFGK